MRSINNEPVVHKGSPTSGGRHFRKPGKILCLFILTAILGIGSGCGDGKDSADGNQTRQSAAAQPTESSQDGPLRIDDSGWRTFHDLGNRIAGGDQVSREELDAVYRVDAFRQWYICLGPTAPPAHRLGFWLEASLQPQLERTSQPMIKSYRYSYESRQSIDRQLEEWAGPQLGQKFLAQARLWIDPENLPDPLTIRFMPTLPEIRYCDENILVDTGVLAAGGSRQLARQMVALLYRNLEFETEYETADSSGRDIVANLFRLLAGEGVATWIERAPNTHFKPNHFLLADIDHLPENFFQDGADNIRFFNQALSGMLNNPKLMKKNGPAFQRQAAGGGLLSRTGYAMAETIVLHLGEEGLLAAKESVPAFLAAYQEAALQNPVPQPAPRTPGIQLAESMGPLDPDVFAKLHDLLESVSRR